MSGKEKSFNIKLYAAVAFSVVAVLLAVICVFTFKARYTAFHPDKVAEGFVNSIVQSGDGYNAYKNTLVSVNYKYGDFIRKNYIEPIVYRDTDYFPGDSTDGLKGYNDDSYKGEKTLSDDGTLAGELAGKMYPVYSDLVEVFGWDEYHKIFKAYSERLIIVREEIFGDKYMSDEVFFTCFESNVSEYGKTLTGTDDEFDPNTNEQISVKALGEYEKAYGEDYKLTVKAEGEKEISLDEYKKNTDKDIFETYSVSAEDISEARVITVKVYVNETEEVASADITVVKIGMSWYVDNTSTDTAELYGFYK